MISFNVFLMILVVGLLSAFGGLYLKKGSKNFRLNFRSLNKFLILGILFNVFSLSVYVYVLRFEDLSVLFPFVALNYVWVSLLSKYYLKEKINFSRLLGILFILIGVILVGFGA